MSNLANPTGALAEDPQYGPRTEQIIAANSISKGELVALSSSLGYAIRNLVATSAGLQFGIAQADIASGRAGLIVVGGFAVAKKGTTACTVGQLVIADPTTSGTVVTTTPATAVTQAKDVAGLVGRCVTAATAGDTTVNIYVGKF
jgi:predicted RecA/RadA family phage recombinase